MEEWRQIPGYEGYYEVSNLGRIKGVEREITFPDGHTAIRKERMKKLTTNPDGYKTVKLSRDGTDRRVPVHRIVYSAFCGDIPDGYEINHIDFDRKNNTPENLEAVTHSENIAYTVAAGRHVSSTMDFSGEKNPNYGNNILSKRYAADKEESKRKQGRPGLKNGRCRKITATFNDGHTEVFDYITGCASELIKRNIAKASVDSVISAIISAIAKDKAYRKIKFNYVQ